MQATSEREQIQPGDQVIDANGQYAGQVVAVLPQYLAVSRGEFWTTNSYVPWSDVRGRTNGQVILDIAGAQVRSRWG